MKQEFVKFEGLGNDFVLLDCRNKKVNLSDSQIRKIGDRRLGIGCDQILMLKSPTEIGADFLYVVFNADGTKSEHCGNGLRCVAAYFKKFLNHTDELKAQVGTETFEIQFLKNNLFCVEHAPPVFEPKEIGLQYSEPLDRYSSKINDTYFEFGAVSVGNPHAVIRIDNSVKDTARIFGPLFQEKGLFQMGVNVGFFKLINRNTIELCVWERGVGYTPACGTGAGAAVVIGQKWGLLDLQVKVVQEGGDLEILTEQRGGKFKIIGPANYVYTGNIDL